MEPPCEHGGVRREANTGAELLDASMEPPCEHGGVLLLVSYISRVGNELQWSRRVNTAECASASIRSWIRCLLQWSRRVNTAE